MNGVKIKITQVRLCAFCERPGTKFDKLCIFGIGFHNVPLGRYGDHFEFGTVGSFDGVCMVFWCVLLGAVPTEPRSHLLRSCSLETKLVHAPLVSLVSAFAKNQSITQLNIKCSHVASTHVVIKLQTGLSRQCNQAGDFGVVPWFPWA